MKEALATVQSFSDSVLLEKLSDAETKTAVFSVLYRRHFDILKELACRLDCDPGLAADMVQDIFLSLYQRGQWEDIGNVSAWLKSALYKRILNYKRNEFIRAKLLAQRNLSNHLEGYSGLSYDMPQLLKAFYLCIKRKSYEEVFDLLQRGELSVAEVAEQTGLSKLTVERYQDTTFAIFRKIVERYLRSP